MKRLTREQILDDFIENFGKHPENRAIKKRANTSDGCVYYASNKNRCAVGRWLKPSKELPQGITYKNLDAMGSIEDVDAVLNDNLDLDVLFKEEVHGQELDFWQELQSLHDNHNHFNTTGFTQEGEDAVSDFRKRWIGFTTDVMGDEQKEN